MLNDAWLNYKQEITIKFKKASYLVNLHKMVQTNIDTEIVRNVRFAVRVPRVAEVTVTQVTPKARPSAKQALEDKSKLMKAKQIDVHLISSTQTRNTMNQISETRKKCLDWRYPCQFY